MGLVLGGWQGFDPIYSKGFEGGVKINTLNDRIRDSIVYYNIKEDDTIVFDPFANISYANSLGREFTDHPNPTLKGTTVSGHVPSTLEGSKGVRFKHLYFE